MASRALSYDNQSIFYDFGFTPPPASQTMGRQQQPGYGTISTSTSKKRDETQQQTTTKANSIFDRYAQATTTFGNSERNYVPISDAEENVTNPCPCGDSLKDACSSCFSNIGKFFKSIWNAGGECIGGCGQCVKDCGSSMNGFGDCCSAADCAGCIGEICCR